MDKTKTYDRLDRFIRIWAMVALVQFAGTIWLWTPHKFLPQIPFFEWLTVLPVWLDYLFLAVTGLSLLAGIFCRQLRNRKLCCLAFSVSAVCLIAFDQNRMQPWAYQFVIYAFVFWAAPKKVATDLLRYIAISIYVYSAISKFDYQFIHTVGQTMWNHVVPESFQTFAGIQNRVWPVLFLPAFELVVAVLLIPRSTRKIGAWAAIFMHGVLLVVLGPFGMNQKTAVLIWNLFFILQAIYLFLIPCDDRFVDANPRTFRTLAAKTLAAFVILFPSTQLAGICDHWPAWEVYAPRTSRAKYAIPNVGGWREPIDIQEISLKELSVPVYPQARYQFAVLDALNSDPGYASDQEWSYIPITVQSPSDRWTGERKENTIRFVQSESWAQRYWLNTKPRR